MTKRLLKELLDKARQRGADSMQLMRVNADESAVTKAVKDLGFERITTNYTMKKTFD